jgi:4-amino-4-deoxychorismate lyase
MFWYNGKLLDSNKLELEITDPGLLYGATIFTTMRIYQQSLTHPLTHWLDHRHRLESSREKFAWKQPNWERIETGIAHLINLFPVLRITLFPDGKEWILGRDLPKNLSEKQQQGVKGWVAEDAIYHRSLAEYKTGNYLGAYLALQKAQILDYQEAILSDSQGNWLETATGNLWGWKEGIWWTPPVTMGILPGIGRSHLINHLQQQGIPIQETCWSWEFVRELEAIVYSNSVVEVIPFQSIFNTPQPLNLDPQHPSIYQLKSLFQ